jgi:hypothetical protein
MRGAWRASFVFQRCIRDEFATSAVDRPVPVPWSQGHATGRFAFGVIREPQGLNVKEMHPESSLENAADVALPATFGADEEDKHTV